VVGVAEREQTAVSLEPARWAVEIFELEKRFQSRKGMPMDWGMGGAHWIISSLVKYRKKLEWCRAVDGVSLKVARGELLGLLGPNGAGKTTLMKCLATLLEIDGGEAFVNGFSVQEQPAGVRLSMNLVGCGHWVAFDWGMTVTQNLHFFGSLYGLTKAERQERIDHTLELLGLGHVARRTPGDLSSGERQRILLAKGFMIRTPIFFLDEPTVGLDPQGARDVRDYIQKELIGKSGTSAILTTHRMPEAEALCSRIAIMHQGRVVACGTPLELKALAGERSVLEIRAVSMPAAAVEAVRRMPDVRNAVAAPVGGDSLEESLRVHSDDADTFAGRGVDLLRRQGVEITSVEVQEPSLEDAFIALTERRLE
jgi:ABC-2 type transport system ATP-binding protein